MEQVENPKRYRKVIDSVVIYQNRGREGGAYELKSEAKAYFTSMVADWNATQDSGAFLKSFENRYDVDGTTLLGWTATIVEFEWAERKPKAKVVREPKAVTVKVVREPKVRKTVDSNGKPIVYTKGKRVVKKRGMTGATVVAKKVGAILTPEELAERKARLRGGHFIRYN